MRSMSAFCHQGAEASTNDDGEEAILLGTNMYLAPEYVRRGEVSPSVDVYAFGVVLLEIITGSPALDNSRSIGMHCYRILDSTYRRLLL